MVGLVLSFGSMLSLLMREIHPVTELRGIMYIEVVLICFLARFGEVFIAKIVNSVAHHLPKTSQELAIYLAQLNLACDNFAKMFDPESKSVEKGGLVSIGFLKVHSEHCKQNDCFCKILIDETDQTASEKEFFKNFKLKQSVFRSS